MTAATLTPLTAKQVAELDPYALMAVLGKRVIHPGGREATAELLRRGDFRPEHSVLDVGCGVGTTAVEITRRFGCRVTAVDIASLMLERARANVTAAGLKERVDVEPGDITALPYEDGSFDRVLAEAVTMFVDRPRAAQELVRICRPGGRVLATEFLWRTTPSEQARSIFLGEICPGMTFDTLDDWLQIYQAAGLRDIEVATGPFEMMTPSGFLRDEGVANSMRVMGRAISRPVYLQRMTWLMRRMRHAVPYLGYIAISGTKPA